MAKEKSSEGGKRPFTIPSNTVEVRGSADGIEKIGGAGKVQRPTTKGQKKEA